MFLKTAPLSDEDILTKFALEQSMTNDTQTQEDLEEANANVESTFNVLSKCELR